MLLADFGTSYIKLLDTAQEGIGPRVIPTRDFNRDRRVDIATGHNGRKYADYYVNELTALARGGERLIREDCYTLLDCGSLDIKFVRYEHGQVKDMGWNAECGASMGFTIELLEKYYDLDFSSLAVPAVSFSVTCGVLGMSHIFDAVINGQSESEAVARFVKGIALNAYNFAGKPDRLYLSGGLCSNPLFIRSFPCNLVPLGRFVLLEGLKGSLALIGEHPR